MLVTTQCYWLHSYTTPDKVLQRKARDALQHQCTYNNTYKTRKRLSLHHTCKANEPHASTLLGIWPRVTQSNFTPHIKKPGPTKVQMARVLLTLPSLGQPESKQTKPFPLLTDSSKDLKKFFCGNSVLSRTECLTVS